MEKWSGLKIGEYEIVDPSVARDDDFEYEEITVEQLLDKNNYSSIQKKQFLNTYAAVNIHQLLAAETYDSCFKLLDDIKNDPRLAGLNAVIFLKLKPKGDRNKYHSLETQEQFNVLIKTAQDKDIAVGMDSCTAPLMLKFAEQNNQEEIVPSIEPCESGLFSIYIDVDSRLFPCSFSPGCEGWVDGIDVLNAQNFIKDVWFSDRLNEWRKKLLFSNCKGCPVSKHCRSCPIYNITPCKIY